MTRVAFGRGAIGIGFLSSAVVFGCGDDESRGTASQAGPGGGAGATESPSSGEIGNDGGAAGGVSGGVGRLATGGREDAAGAQAAVSGSGNSTSAPSHIYHACASAVATGQAPMIANFDDGSERVLSNEGRGGIWFSYDDATNGEFTHAVDNGALHVTSDAWTGWGAGFGFSIGPWLPDGQRCFYNAEKYAGVRFRAKGKGRIRPLVVTQDNLPVTEGGACQRAPNDCYNHPGGYARLTSAWQTFEFPFCALRPQPVWGGAGSPIKPSELIAVQFVLSREGQHYDFWLDDLEFFTAATAQHAVNCAKPCPMDLVPYPETTVPDSAELPLTGGRTLHTFDQATLRCGTIRRRYLSFVPPYTVPVSDAPVVILMHGSGGNAENMDYYMTKGRFNELAVRDGFIVVYGNAAPGELSNNDPSYYNSGSWRQDLFDDGEVDDVEYLALVLADLKARSVISGSNDVYLLGMSNGGGMVLKAATERPEMWSGIAPFMAFDGWEPPPVPQLIGTRLKRILFGISPEDPGLYGGTYTSVLSTLPATWAAAMGIPQNAIQNPEQSALPNVVNEGESYTGSNAVALRTRNSSVTQIDMSAAGIPGKLRVLEFARGGHFWPNPVADADPFVNEGWGFRNQDLDASDAAWDFLRSSN
jgi:polyhydroxybutyrate depolymerase